MAINKEFFTILQQFVICTIKSFNIYGVENCGKKYIINKMTFVKYLNKEIYNERMYTRLQQLQQQLQ